MRRSSWRWLLLGVVLLVSAVIWSVAVPTDAASTVVLEFWVPGNDEPTTKFMRDVIARFEAANPGVKVNLTRVPWGEYFVKVNTAFAGNMEPDVFGLGYAQFGQVVAQGHLAPLDPDALDLDDVLPNVLEAGTYNGQLYGLLYPEIRVLMYRKDMFRDAGLDPEKPPRNWDEFYEYALKLIKRDRRGRVIQIAVDAPTQNGEQPIAGYLVTMGTNIWGDGGAVTLNSPEFIQAMEYWSALFEAGAIIPGDQYQVQGSYFENGLAAMTTSLSTAQLRDMQSRFGENLGVAVPPVGKQPGALSLGTFWVMSRRTPHKDLALKLIAELYSPESLWDIYHVVGFIPTRESLQARLEETGEVGRVLAETIRYARGYPPNPKGLEHLDIVRKAIEASYHKEKPIEQVLKEAAAHARAIGSGQ